MWATYGKPMQPGTVFAVDPQMWVPEEQLYIRCEDAIAVTETGCENLTGDESYLRKVRGLWKDVAGRQMYITGGVSVGEHYEPGYRRPVSGHVVETCANMSWMQLTQDLLALSGETDRRVFDVFVNDVKVATQALDRDKPGEFFEVRYAIPFELIQGKTNSLGQKVDSVTVMFQAQGDSTAGGVFGIRTVAKTADDAPKTR